MQITEVVVEEEEALQGSEKDENSYVFCHAYTMEAYEPFWKLNVM